MKGIVSTVLLSCAMVYAAGDEIPKNPPSLDPVGKNLIAPRLLHKEEPRYTPQALQANIQGTVIYDILVTEEGRAANVTVISPVGFGLDEEGQKTIEAWRWSPATKNGVAVVCVAQVEVNFRLLNSSFNEKAEQRRSAFNEAQSQLKNGNAKEQTKAVQAIQSLAKQKYPPAMTQLGGWMLKGEHVEKDESGGWAMVELAAKKNNGPAMYLLAKRDLEAKTSPESEASAMKEMGDAAVLGSAQAQFLLGNKYDRGLDVEQNQETAQRYFRLCAARGVPECQYRLARVLIDRPDQSTNRYGEGVAWLRLASAKSLPEAKLALDQISGKLTPEQEKFADNWSKRLATK